MLKNINLYLELKHDKALKNELVDDTSDTIITNEVE